MNTVHQDPLPKELQDFLSQHADMSGAKILRFLLNYPGHKFHCAKLSHLVFPPEHERLEMMAEQADLHETLAMQNESGEQGNTISLRDPANPQLTGAKNPDAYDLADLVTCRHYDNPTTDAKTLADIKLRVAKLKRDIAAGIKPEAAQEEIRQLYQYRSACLRPGNRIKQSNPETDKCYQALYQALRRLLNKIPGEQAPLLEYVKQHLRTGMEFVWL